MDQARSANGRRSPRLQKDSNRRVTFLITMTFRVPARAIRTISDLNQFKQSEVRTFGCSVWCVYTDILSKINSNPCCTVQQNYPLFLQVSCPVKVQTKTTLPSCLRVWLFRGMLVNSSAVRFVQMSQFRFHLTCKCRITSTTNF